MRLLLFETNSLIIFHNWWYKTHQSIDLSSQLANFRHIVNPQFFFIIYKCKTITGLVAFSFRVVCKKKKKNFRHFAIEFSVYVSDSWEMMVVCYCAHRVWTLMHRQNAQCRNFLANNSKTKATTTAHNGVECDRKAFCDWNRTSILFIFILYN